MIGTVVGLALVLVFPAISGLVMVWFGLQDSHGDNPYGPSPKDHTAVAGTRPATA